MPKTGGAGRSSEDVVESWNGGNQVIFFGNGGDIASNRRDEQELSVLCLRVLRSRRYRS